MGKSEIRLRNRISSSRIERHRNYSDVLNRHNRDNKIKRLFRAFMYFLAILFVLIILLTIIRWENRHNSSEKTPTSGVLDQNSRKSATLQASSAYIIVEDVSSL